MAENVGRTLVCSVRFLDIVGYTKQSVAQQHEVKQAFNDTLAKALATTAQRDRIILDTGGGAAVPFFGDPENALQGALTIHDSIDLPVCMGLNEVWTAVCELRAKWDTRRAARGCVTM